MVQEFGRDPDARVGDEQLDGAPDPPDACAHGAPIGCELHRVCQQVPRDLLEPGGITVDEAQAGSNRRNRTIFQLLGAG
jgi:hypothetical protein